MNCRDAVLLGLAAIVAAGCVSTGDEKAQDPEPRNAAEEAGSKDLLYDGKPLSGWTQELSSSDLVVVTSAIEALTRIGKDARGALPEIYRVFLKYSGDIENGHVVTYCCKAFVAFEELSVPYLVDFVENGPKTISRVRVLQTIQEIGRPARSAAPMLMKFYSMESYAFIFDVGGALSRLGDLGGQDKQRLLDILIRHPSPAYRQSAGLALTGCVLGAEHLEKLKKAREANEVALQKFHESEEARELRDFGSLRDLCDIFDTLIIRIGVRSK